MIMPIYNLLEWSKNYLETSSNLRQYQLDKVHIEATDPKNNRDGIKEIIHH